MEKLPANSDALQLVSKDSQTVLADINASTNQPVTWPSVATWGFCLSFFGVAGLAALCFIAASIHADRADADYGLVGAFILYSMFLIVPGATYIFGMMGASNDTLRRTYELNYELDAVAVNRLVAIENVVSILLKNEKISYIASEIETTDRKRHAGSSIVDSYEDAKLAKSSPPLIQTNVTPYCFDLGKNQQKIYFMPDRIYVYQDGKDGAVEYGAVEYKELNIEVKTVRVSLDTMDAPSDADVVGKTFKKVNKDGSQDLRFKYNPEVPICRFGHITFMSPQGLNILIEVSNVLTAQEFVNAYLNMASNLSTEKANDLHSQNSLLEQLAPSPATQSGLIHSHPPIPVEGGYLPCPSCGFLNTPLDGRCSRCHKQLSNVFEDNITQSTPAPDKQEPADQKEQKEAQEMDKPDTEQVNLSLLNSLHSKDKQERLASAIGLCDTRKTEYIKSVMGIMHQITWDEVDDLEVPLSRFGVSALPYLIALLPGSKKPTAACAMRALGHIGGNEAARALVEQLISLPTKFEPTEALVLMGKEAIPFLSPLLKDHIADVREMAAFALGKIGDINSLTILQEMASSDRSGKVQGVATHAVRWIRAEEKCDIDLRHISGAVELG